MYEYTEVINVPYIRANSFTKKKQKIQFKRLYQNTKYKIPATERTSLNQK